MTLANHLQHRPSVPFFSRSLYLHPPSLSVVLSRFTYRVISTISIGFYAEGGYLLVWLPMPNKAVRRLRQLGLTSNPNTLVLLYAQPSAFDVLSLWRYFDIIDVSTPLPQDIEPSSTFATHHCGICPWLLVIQIN